MALEAAFTELEDKLEQLDRIFDDLLWAVVQGQPEAEQGHALVDYYDAAASDLIGLVKEAKEAAEEGQKATKGQLDLPGTRQALVTCQDRFNRLSGRFYSELISFYWIGALNNLATERGGEWAQWVQGVKDALSRCPQPLNDVSLALFPCWQDLTERASLLSVVAQMTSIGAWVYLDQEQPGEK